MGLPRLRDSRARRMWRRFNFFDKKPLEASKELSRLSSPASAAGFGPGGTRLFFFASENGACILSRNHFPNRFTGFCRLCPTPDTFASTHGFCRACVHHRCAAQARFRLQGTRHSLHFCQVLEQGVCLSCPTVAAGSTSACLCARRAQYQPTLHALPSDGGFRGGVIRGFRLAVMLMPGIPFCPDGRPLLTTQHRNIIITVGEDDPAAPLASTSAKVRSRSLFPGTSLHSDDNEHPPCRCSTGLGRGPTAAQREGRVAATRADGQTVRPEVPRGTGA